MKQLLVFLLLLASPLLAQERVDDGILSMYWFSEGTGNIVQDVAVSPVPIHLTIADPTNVSWVLGGGLTINSPTKIASSIRPWWISTIESTGEFSVELWVEPGNYTQSGPARIAAYSLNGYPGGGNFVVGQAVSELEVRIRTSVTDVYGMPGVTSSAGSGLIHIVITRSTLNVTTLFVNGTKVASASNAGIINNWGDYYFALANEQSNDRPWLGTFYFFGLFDRELTEAEVAQNFNFGHLPLGPVDPPEDIPVDTRYTWTAPTTGTPVVQYIAEVKTARNPNWVAYAVTETTSITYTGIAGVTQWIRVAGRDAESRQGPFSPESEPYAPPFPDVDPPSKPGKPYRVR